MRADETHQILDAVVVILLVDVLGGAPFWLVRHYWGARVGLPGGHLVVPMFDTKLRLEASAGAGLPTFAAPQSSQQASISALGNDE